MGEAPEVTARTHWRYKARLRRELAAQAEAARDLALTSGLANRGSHVAELRRAFVKLTHLEAGEKGAQTRVLLAKEKRETLKQIALELGQLPSGASITINAAAVANAEATVETDDEQARQDLDLLLTGIIEREVATALALTAAQRPDRTLSD